MAAALNIKDGPVASVSEDQRAAFKRGAKTQCSFPIPREKKMMLEDDDRRVSSPKPSGVWRNIGCNFQIRVVKPSISQESSTLVTKVDLTFFDKININDVIEPSEVAKLIGSSGSKEQIKRQSDICEIIKCEALQCRAIKDLLLYAEEHNIVISLQDINEFRVVFEWHYKLLSELRKLQGSGCVVAEIGGQLRAHLNAKKCDDMKKTYVNIITCIEEMIQKCPKPVPAPFLLVPIRLTKLALQLDSLLKNSAQEGQLERANIKIALDDLKIILTFINCEMDKIVKAKRLKAIVKNFSSKPFPFAGRNEIVSKDLIAHRTLLHEDTLSVLIKKQKTQEVTALVFDEILCFLYKGFTGKYNFYEACHGLEIVSLQNIVVMETDDVVHGISIIIKEETRGPVLLSATSRTKRAAFVAAVKSATENLDAQRTAILARCKKQGLGKSKASTLSGFLRSPIVNHLSSIPQSEKVC